MCWAEYKQQQTEIIKYNYLKIVLMSCSWVKVFSYPMATAVTMAIAPISQIMVWR